MQQVLLYMVMQWAYDSSIVVLVKLLGNWCQCLCFAEDKNIAVRKLLSGHFYYIYHN